jgi:toxin ParE1/3/4
MRGMEGDRRPVIWSPEARADLNGIWDYYEEVAGRTTAEKVSRNIIRSSDVLAHHPLAGRSRGEIRAGLRSLVANPHVFFYRVTDSDMAEIVRILDERQDIDAAFTVRGVERRA